VIQIDRIIDGIKVSCFDDFAAPAINEILA
jgi:hypothetical protein